MEVTPTTKEEIDPEKFKEAHKECVEQADEYPNTKDYLQAQNKPSFSQLLGHGERVCYSTKIRKINLHGWGQERTLIITAQKIYNIKTLMVSKSTKMMRSIYISKLGGISKTTLPGSKEFTIHVPTEYDYRFCSDHKDEIVRVIQVLYFIKNGDNLPVFGIPKQKLDEFTTTEKDMLKSRTRFPPLKYRIFEADIV